MQLINYTTAAYQLSIVAGQQANETTSASSSTYIPAYISRRDRRRSSIDRESSADLQSLEIDMAVPINLNSMESLFLHSNSAETADETAPAAVYALVLPKRGRWPRRIRGWSEVKVRVVKEDHNDQALQRKERMQPDAWKEQDLSPSVSSSISTEVERSPASDQMTGVHLSNQPIPFRAFFRPSGPVSFNILKSNSSVPDATSSHATLLLLPAIDPETHLSSLPDSKSMSDLLLPATHQSLSLRGWPISQCQERQSGFEVQLRSGVRWFDVRLSVVDDRLVGTSQCPDPRFCYLQGLDERPEDCHADFVIAQRIMASFPNAPPSPPSSISYQITSALTPRKHWFFAFNKNRIN